MAFWQQNPQQKQYQQQQQQIQISKQQQIQIVVETQLFLDQLSNCFKAIDDYAGKYYNSHQSKYDHQNSISIVVGSINVFGKMCRIQSKKQNQRGLDLCSYRLEEYLQKYSKNDKRTALIEPFIRYIYCGIKGQKLSIIPAIKTNDNDWNSNTANGFMSHYLGSGHAIDNKMERYEQNAQQLNRTYEQEWKLRNKKSVTLGKEMPLPPLPNEIYASAHIEMNQLNDSSKKAAYIPVSAEQEILGNEKDHRCTGNCCHHNNRKHKKSKKYHQ